MHSWLSASAWIVFSIKQISRKGREKNPCNSCGLVVYYVVRIIYSVCSIGWGLSEALATRLLPLWFGARGTEFNWKYIQSSFECNINLVSIFQDIFEYVSNLCYIDLSIQHQNNACINLAWDTIDSSLGSYNIIMLLLYYISWQQWHLIPILPDVWMRSSRGMTNSA